MTIINQDYLFFQVFLKRIVLQNIFEKNARTFFDKRENNVLVF